MTPSPEPQSANNPEPSTPLPPVQPETPQQAAPEPIPTPYDIAPIPYFAYAPGLVIWLIFLILALVLVYTAKRGIKLIRKRRIKAFDLACQQLEALKPSTDLSAPMKDDLARASLIVKRYLESAHGFQLAHMTVVELKKFMLKSEDRLLTELLEIISSADTVKYLPKEPGKEETELLQRVVPALKEYHFSKMQKSQ